MDSIYNLILYFSTDGSVTEGGFSMTITAEDSTGGDGSEQGCNGTPQVIELLNVGDSFGIQLPNNGQSEYANNMDCQWRLSVGIISISSLSLIIV